MTTTGQTPAVGRASRSKPVAVEGQVAVLAPTGTSGTKRYYRLTWTNPDGTPGRTSAGLTLDGARLKAKALDCTLGRAAGSKAMLSLDDLGEDYLSSAVGRNAKTGGDWDQTQLKQMRPKVARVLRGHRDRRAMEVARPLLDIMRSQAGTRRTRKENATTLRALLRWGAQQGYFSPEQAELLPTHLYDLVGTVAGTEAPKRRTRVRDVGQSEAYMADEDAPSPTQIVRLGEELAVLLPRWGRLAPELASDSGPRWGELFQFTADDVVHTAATLSKKGKVKRASVHLKINYQIDRAATAGGNRRKPPKGRKRRKASVSEFSITNYPLHEALLARCQEALQERAAGTNPEALLFPNDTGGMFFDTAFHDDYFKIAAIAAGWPYVEWVYKGQRWIEKEQRWVMIEQDRVQFDITWHGLRHRYARTCVDKRGMTAGELMAHGGWENETVVKTLYYHSGEEHFASGARKF